MRSGDIGDEAGRSTADAGPLDLDAVRADDDLIEALSAGLVPPPSGSRDTSDIEGELVALLAGWVADVRPETLLHRPVPPQPPVFVEAALENAEDADEEDPPTAAFSFGTPSLLEHNELPRPVSLAAWRSIATRPYLLRAAAALVVVALVSSGVVARSYGAHPGEPLWAITQMAFPAKSHSVEAAISVSTALNTARVALESGHIDEARQAFETVAAQLADVDADDGHSELAHQMNYINTQLAASPAVPDMQPGPRTETGRPTLATGAVGAVIPSSPAVTPGATAALATPSTPPSVLAAGPNVTSGGSAPAVDGTPAAAGAVVAAPAPSVGPPPAVSAPVVVEPPADQVSNSAPPVVSNPANDPVVSASTTTQQPAPTTVPPATDPTTPPATSDPVDTGTAGPSNTASDGGSANSTPDGAGSSGGTSDSAGSSAATQDTIDTNGAAGSNLGQVTGVVTNTSDSGS